MNLKFIKICFPAALLVNILLAQTDLKIPHDWFPGRPYWEKMQDNIQYSYKKFNYQIML